MLLKINLIKTWFLCHGFISKTDSPNANCKYNRIIFFFLIPLNRFVTAVYPSADDDVITSPYNSVLAMHQLTEHADCVLPIENQVGSIYVFISLVKF